jgi:hypothetical protein
MRAPLEHMVKALSLQQPARCLCFSILPFVLQIFLVQPLLGISKSYMTTIKGQSTAWVSVIESVGGQTNLCRVGTVFLWGLWKEFMLMSVTLTPWKSRFREKGTNELTNEVPRIEPGKGIIFPFDRGWYHRSATGDIHTLLKQTKLSYE